ncbi:peptide ABC transporter substrate-binding protein [Candidatus Gracilibacteria bacterium]|nr:peptide ABC transporter substrate-binding protein [Candidatus Gracilibacteria bacterium]MCF7898582.1 peptide ABC transporter substrate-binding protein [Candidatus Paceibacterota bacterium]
MDISQYQKQWSNLKLNTTKLYKSLSPERVIILWVLSIASVIFFFSALIIYNSRFLITTPIYGGEVREGIIGTPRFINPVLAISDQDRDLTSLIYAGITKKDSQGRTSLDMAQTVVESDDNLKYTITLRKDAEFHDGKQVTSDDVIYTVGLIQNPATKSPYRVKWEGITIEKISDTELRFLLKKPFPLFMDILTLGILPKHLWKNLSDEQISLSDYNLHAIGSGPYSIKKITTDSGIPNTFTLTAHTKYTLGRPYVDTIIISTYQNEKYLLKAYEDGDIDRIYGISSEKIKALKISSTSIYTSLLPRTFAVFFNPNKSQILSDKSVRSALQMSINKQAIVDEVLNKYGKVINDPYPFDEDVTESIYNVEQARALLAENKLFKKASSTLEITLATANTDEMKKVAEMIKADWGKIGVTTSLAIYEVSDLNQSIIKERDFQALLFGTITQTPSDLYAFWHSSQRSYPGLNISNYVSKNLDTNLETLRTSKDELARISAYQDVKKEFSEEVPGIFLFAPSLIYITNDKVTSSLPRYSFDNSSRFTLIESWYRYTDKVWPKTYHKPLTTLLQNIIH